MINIYSTATAIYTRGLNKRDNAILIASTTLILAFVNVASVFCMFDSNICFKPPHIFTPSFTASKMFVSKSLLIFFGSKIRYPICTTSPTFNELSMAAFVYISHCEPRKILIPTSPCFRDTAM